MKNGIVYAVNDNQKFVDKMINSINSCAYFNPGLLDTTIFYILTDAKNIDLHQIDERVKYEIVDIETEKYSELHTSSKKRWTYHIHLRFEIFCNKLFRNLDNVLYVDCDTDFNGSIEDIFIEHDVPVIHMVAECENHLRNRKRKPKYGDLMCPRYYNSGFIFITPKLIGSEVLDAMYSKMKQLPMEFDFEFPDQDAINAVLGTEPYINLLKPLDKSYNYSWWTYPKCKRVDADAEQNYRMKHFGGSTEYAKRFLKEGN